VTDEPQTVGQKKRTKTHTKNYRSTDFAIRHNSSPPTRKCRAEASELLNKFYWRRPVERPRTISLRIVGLLLMKRRLY